MASVRPRSMSTRTGLKPQPVNTHRLSWPESSSYETKSIPRTLATAAGEATRGQENRESREDTFAKLRQISGPVTALSSRRGRESQHASNSHHGIHQSPARSWYGSSRNDDPLPRRTANATPLHSTPRIIARDTSPMRQDSAYESVAGCKDEDSKIVVDLSKENIRTMERLEILRGRVLRTRRDISEKRADVQTLRGNFRDATDKLMRAINKLIVSNTPGDPRILVPYYEEVRYIQDQLGPAEDDYDVLELQLSREETEVEQEENHFYKTNNIFFSPPPDVILDEPLSPLLRTYQPEDIEFENLDLDNELVKQYLSKVAEADHVNERLEILENEQYRLSQDLSFRTRHNYPVSSQTTSFLFEFPQIHKELQGQLEEIEDSLYDLRDRCIEEKLFAPEEHIYQPRDPLLEEIYDSIIDAQDRSPLRTALDRANKEDTLHTDFKNKRDYVNGWLLEWVQDSALETLRLREIIFLDCPNEKFDSDGGDWSDFAVEFWDKDQAGEKYSTQNQVLSTMDALLGGTGTTGEEEEILDIDLGNGGFAGEMNLQSMESSYDTLTPAPIPLSDKTSSENGRKELLLRRRGSKARMSISQTRSI